MRINFYYPNPSRTGLPITHVMVDTSHIPRVGERVDMGDGREWEVESVLYRYTQPPHRQAASITINLK